MQVFTSSIELEFIRRAFFEFVLENDEIPDGRHSLSRRLLLPKGSIEVSVEIGGAPKFGDRERCLSYCSMNNQYAISL